MSREARRIVRSGALKKGDPLQAARIAGIMAAKQTAALIPLCHPLPIATVHVDLKPTSRGYDIESRVRTTAQTGVEMEALTAVAVAALDHLRHGQGCRQDDGHRRYPRDVQERRPIGNLHPHTMNGGACGSVEWVGQMEYLVRNRDRLWLGTATALAGIVLIAGLARVDGAAPGPQSPLRAGSAAPVAGYRVEHTYPHDRDAYTQGLEFVDGYLFESTGMNGRSSIRKVQLETGRVLQSRAVPREHFGEGITIWQSRLIELTWQIASRVRLRQRIVRVARIVHLYRRRLGPHARRRSPHHE